MWVISPFCKLVLIGTIGLSSWALLLLILGTRWKLLNNIHRLSGMIVRTKSVMERMHLELDGSTKELETQGLSRNSELSDKIQNLNAEMTKLLKRFSSLEASVLEFS